ncbi:protein phosphatase 2C domain-containing protein [candidate division NPL-UPA2 bacterium]|nr:protein phosphatase 2C domain-containing protein [candidate division NPL-UPA2 bacterium]
MKFQIGFSSDIGRRKSTNQDKLLVSTTNSPQGREVALFAVADGMGGTEGGGKASGIAMERLKQWYTSVDIDRLAKSSNKTILNSLHKCFIIINELILNYSRENNIKPGTTLSVILVIEHNFFLAHTGDSRIYLHRKNKTKQLTLDHSFVAEQVRLGRLTPAEAEKDRRKNELTQCLGIKGKTEVFLLDGKLKNNDILLLCSDGLYNYIKIETINNNVWQGAKKSAEIQKLVDQLVETANEKGGKDNISLILARATASTTLLGRIAKKLGVSNGAKTKSSKIK